MASPPGQTGIQADDDYLRRRVRQDPVRALRELWSPRFSYLDLLGDPGRSVLVLSSGRSGSTLFAELLATNPGFRLIFEPFRAHRVALSRDIRRGRFEPPEHDDADLTVAMTRVLSGRFRSVWADAYNTSRLPRGRIVKEVRTNNLAPWIVRHFPEVPVIYLVRHPVATARSVDELGWRDDLDDLVGQERLMSLHFAPWRAVIDEAMADDRGTLVALVLRWCLENHVPITMLPRGSVHVVFFEDLVLDPVAELDRLASFLRRRRPDLWASWHPDAKRLEQPSRSDWRNGRPQRPEERVSGWRSAVDEEDLTRSVKLLDAFGLSRVYGADPLPLVRPEELLSGPGA
ncbi:MAG TPA: sulfotransferase [Acidimicrobiales bacterium]|nr:sulfotransferase [Acidimicrobiales bacterium]